MKTKGIPAVVMLLAGFVTCIIGIVQHMETDVYQDIACGLIIFYVLGCIVKLVLDKNLKKWMNLKKTRKSPEKNRHRNSQTRMGEKKSE